MTDIDRQFMLRAIALAQAGMDANAGGPFGAIVVKDGEVIGEGSNAVTSTNDPTAHAEIVAIRNACRRLGSFQLSGCSIYTSCEPCPMCLGAIYWSRPDKVFFACTRQDAAEIGFDDDFLYREMTKSNDDRALPIINLMRDESLAVFKNWAEKPDKTKY
jgi:tRNA(Arg) A34 adenosine deaminase TadA